MSIRAGSDMLLGRCCCAWFHNCVWAPNLLLFALLAVLIRQPLLAQPTPHAVVTLLCPPCLAEWDLGGLPSWLLIVQPALKLRSHDPQYLELVREHAGYCYSNNKGLTACLAFIQPDCIMVKDPSRPVDLMCVKA